jgi:hypothetical protein
MAQQSERAPTPDPANEQPIETAFSLQLVSQVSITKGKRPKTQSSRKEITTKEMKFTCLEDNYISFLRAILEKCGLRYKVSEATPYRFKYFHTGRM